jgi:hypothetical protein
MKIARSVGLLRFGGVLTGRWIVRGIDLVLRYALALGVEAGDAGAWVGIVVDCGQRSEKQAADLGEDAGATRGDAALGQECVEDAARLVDAVGILETAGLLGRATAKSSESAGSDAA